jgi:hypothetical protein
MDESSTKSRKLQWKWVAITLSCYLIFYVLPLYVMAHIFKGNVGIILVGVWLCGGIFVISAITAYLSKGITILEPAIASVLMVLLMWLFDLVSNPLMLANIKREIVVLAISMTLILIFSLIGAWIGEQIQKYRKVKGM